MRSGDLTVNRDFLKWYQFPKVAFPKQPKNQQTLSEEEKYGMCDWEDE